MICPKCGSEMEDGSAFCTKCGAALGENRQQGNGAFGPGAYQGNPNNGQGNPGNGQPYGNGMPYGAPYGNPNPQPYVDPKDHSAEFEPKDVGEHKLLAMLPYLLGVVGIVIALLADKESPYLSFHVRQGLKLTVCTTLVSIASAILCFTVVVPIAGAVCLIILAVVRIICFCQVCSGKSKEPAIVSSFGFLR